jgi:hypothetical protein
MSLLGHSSVLRQSYSTTRYGPARQLQYLPAIVWPACRTDNSLIKTWLHATYTAPADVLPAAHSNTTFWTHCAPHSTTNELLLRDFRLSQRCRLRCDTVESGRISPTFRRHNKLVSFFRVEDITDIRENTTVRSDCCQNLKSNNLTRSSGKN